MSIRPEVLPYIGRALLFGAGIALMLRAAGSGWCCAGLTGTTLAGLVCVGLVFFFRDPPRTPPGDPDAILAGADGVIMDVKTLTDDSRFDRETVCISTFLSLFDVHVNRSPLAGQVEYVHHSPGTKRLAWKQETGDTNERNEILVKHAETHCLVNQIVGFAARRIDCWVTPEQSIARGERIGMMKFGSRLDVYLPRNDVSVLVAKGSRVRAGETVIARFEKGDK